MINSGRYSTELSSELSIFEEQFISDAILSKSVDPRFPITSITDNVSAPIEFEIDGNEFAIRPRDCNIHLNISLIGEKVTTTPAVGEALATQTVQTVLNAANPCTQINNIGHSLFSKITTSLGGREISTLTNYNYISYINTRLNFADNTLNSFGQLGGWFADDPDDMDSVSITAANSSLKVRKAWWNANGSLDLVINPFSPILMSEKIIIPRTSLKIRLERVSDPKFYLMYPHAVANERVAYKIRINEAIFNVQRVELTPEYVIGLETMLREKEIPVVYKLPEPQILIYNVPTLLTQFSVNNMFNGNIPPKILVMFVAASAYNGDNTRNPFNFRNANVQSIALYKNGIPFPQPPLATNFTSKTCALAYYTTLKSLHAPSPIAPCLTFKEYLSGTTIFAYDTTPDSSGTPQLSSLINRTTNIRLEVTFSVAPIEPLVCLVYYERDIRVSIDVGGNVAVETIF
jgi:hypothetical protein